MQLVGQQQWAALRSHRMIKKGGPEPKKEGTVGFVVTIVILSAVVVGLGALSVFALVRGGFITFDKFAGKKKGAKQTEENAEEKGTEENSTEE